MDHTDFMLEAIHLAHRAKGKTAPNPTVGAVFVRDGEIIGKGYHKKAGTPHAEVLAARDAQKQGYTIEGATLYCTLEPCAHYGKTPPCADFLIQKKIQEVVIGMQDSFRLVNGGGLKKLKDAGIRVTVLPKTDALYKKIQLLNQPFLKWATTGLPYVTMKAAVSLDGKIATATKQSQWITGERARQDARRERSMADAVLVGAGTVTDDDPELLPHGAFRSKQLLRIIIDPTLSLPLSKKVFRDPHVLVATTELAPKETKLLYEKNGIPVKSFGKKRVSIKQLLQYLGKQEIQHVFIEGGAGVHGSFYDESLADPLILDRVLWYVSPKIIGGVTALSAVGGEGIRTLKEAKPLTDVVLHHVGQDMKIEGYWNIY
ncbi:MAG: bifunctional diaminohydroxyphosphoribosylaminopyrimidine deaminase/5-amino-6-(5-phosphoribosylamino)uracil reductase RibD [Candidatus Magasanikbacteria bacterium]|nr:bifunctional diaminohydroxyphosphoribosylaminopyrimidine deaminase/5-amino-6-(5-phosphoribosylamino)uracil reductase RibD [Candidatus Magasanikbacteria bacterium]